ncbi:MAG: DUF4347 domain-containing protein [Pirellulaceae bacterium]|nr:DUF4347 domain-containing protein [Pirellulaceae bacterium]
MLAGDAAWAVASVGALASPATTSGPTSSVVGTALTGNELTSPRTSVDRIVFIDSAVADSDLLGASIDDAEIVLIGESQDPIAQISQTLAHRRDVGSLHIVSHGEAGKIQLGGKVIDATTIAHQSQHIAKWSRALRPDADILVYGCDVAADSQGQRFVAALAKITGADVAASTNRTGAIGGADWDLEHTIGVIEAGVAFEGYVLANYRHTLPITIRAAGLTGEEQMALQIDGQTVQTWSNIGGDYYAGQFETFTYTGGDTVTGDRVRVVFTNDLYDPPNIDRNLRVDNITVNGVTIETEHPSVFSTGTWKSSDGITAGFRESEFMHAGGYFEYFDPGGNTGNGSVINIRAAGVTNEETMELRIDGRTVSTWLNVGGNAYGGQFVDLTFTASETVTADQIQIAFTNDLYVDGVIDRNLRVDWIEIDGQRLQTEDPSVYSTGTWLPGDGIQPGFRTSEYLHTNGYFQYAGGGGNPGGESSFQLASSQITVSESDGSATLTIVRTGDLSASASVDYQTFDQDAISGDDYTTTENTITFSPNQSSRDILIPIIDNGDPETTETFSFTIDNPNGADLGIPRTATITILDDDLPLPNYADFQNASGIVTNGGASLVSGKLQITSDSTFQTGSAFYDTPILANADTSFQTAFSFEMTGGSGAGGADGILFVLQNSAAGASALGRGGSGVGYDDIGNSIAVELDTWRNGWDLYNDEVGVLAGGEITNHLAQVQAPFNLNFGGVYYAWVDYNGISDSLSVYVSETSTKPTAATLKTTVSLDAYVGSQFYAGFTSSNYDRPNAHRILSWTMNLETPPADPPVNPSGDVSELVVASGFVQPIAIDWSPDGRNMYVAEKGGVVKVLRDGQSVGSPVIDISAIVNDYSDRGLLDIAVHPDLANNPYLYLLYTYDPPEVNNHTGNANARPDGSGNRAGRLMRITLNSSTNYTTMVGGSETILLGNNSTWDNFNGFVNSVFNVSEPPAGQNPDGSYLQDFINSDSTTHTVGSLAFESNNSLFVSIGDGASYNNVDPRAVRVQDIDSLSGKILRINPITGDGLADNPFYNGNPDANRSKVYQLGLRNPFRISVDDATGQLYVGDVGWTRWEEINTGGAGTNFGWPYYEGGQGVNYQTGGGYANLSEAQAFYASGAVATPGAIALNHATDGINAIVMGDVLRNGDLGQQYEGDIFFNDLGQGIVRSASIDANGVLTNMQVFTTGAQYFVTIRQGPDGSLYFVDLVDGYVGKWQLV